MYIYTMAHMTPGEEAALNEVMQMLEAEPVDTTSSPNPLVSVTNDDNIPAQREKLAILVSTGKSKEAIGVQLTHDQVKRLSDKDVQKYSKRYEAYIGNKTTEALVDSFIITAKHIMFEKGNDHNVPPNTPTLTHPTRDSDGYPLGGVDEVGSDLIKNLKGTLKESIRNLTGTLQVFF